MEISTIYWNHGAFCGHSLGKPHGMMGTQWSFSAIVEFWPALARFGVIASSGIIAWIIVKKWTRYEFGLGQGRLGMKSGKRSILQKMLYLHFMMIPVRYPFSAFDPKKITPLSRKNQYNYISLDSLNPPFQYSRTHYSIIPLFHHSNCGAKRS